MRITKKAVAIALTAIMALSTICASAAWVPAGYDCRDLNNIGKFYNEVIDGNYTSNHKREALDAEDIKWVAEGFELAYPHAGYERLYLEGNYQVITRYNNTFPQWETKFADYLWELSGKHQIYQRQQTNIPNRGWTWDFGKTLDVDKTLLVPTNRFAEVEESFDLIGVGKYDLTGREIGKRIVPVDADLTDAAVQAEIKAEGVPFVPANIDELKGDELIEALNKIIADRLEEDEHILAMYRQFGIDYDLHLEEGEIESVTADIFPVERDFDNDGDIDYKSYEVIDGRFLSEENLSRKNNEGMIFNDGTFVVSDEKIAEEIPAIYTKVLDGPTLVTDGHKVLSEEYLAGYANGSANWVWDNDSIKAWQEVMAVDYDANGEEINKIVVENPVSWTEPVFETKEPYYMYQYLVVGGLVFDGRHDLPRIVRMTGGKATPVVEWKYAFVEAAEPFEIIEAKYVNGVLARDHLTGEPTLRRTQEYGNYHYEVTPTSLQIWLKDELVDTILLNQEINHIFGYNVYGPSGSFLTGDGAQGAYKSDDAATK